MRFAASALSSCRPMGLATVCAWLASAAVLSAAAQPSSWNPSHVIAHPVRAGDTLEHLAQRYLGDATLWRELQSHNRVPSPYRLQPGSVLEIPLRLMRTATASVDHVHGNAQVRRAGTPTAVTPRMPLHEGDQLQLAPDAFVAVRLADGSTVRVQAASQVELRQLRRRGRAGSLQSVVDVQQGGVDIQVPGRPDAQRRLDVLTPVAATSVRGTHFDVQLAPDGSTTAAVLQGRVAVHTPQHHATTLARHTGIAVSPQGQASAVTALLPAVAPQVLPTLLEDAQWLQVDLPAHPGARAWRVAVSTDAAGQAVLRNGLFDGARARFAALPDGHYVLHVRPVDAHGISGLPTQVPLRVKAHPVPPLAQSPASGAVLPLGEAALHCTPVDGVDHYQHQIVATPAEASATSADFSQPTWQHTGGGDCRLDLSQLPAGSYAWRAASVRQVDGAPDTGPWPTAGHRFRIAPRPAAPSADDVAVQTVAGVAQLQWPGEPGQRFRLQAFATPDSGTPALDTLLDAPQWTAAGLPAGTWHVRIQVQDPSGLHSAFSPPRSVQVRALVRDGFGQPIHSGTGLGVEHP